MATIIGIKKLHQQLPHIADAAVRGESFIVMRHAQPMFRIEPIRDIARKFTLKDFQKIRFRSRDKNLSKKVDRIAYGI